MSRARRRFGQHFLEPAWVAKLIDALNASPEDVFLEVGPGRGALTTPLARRVRRIVAVEIDRDLAAVLRRDVSPNVRIVEGDFLEVDVQELLLDETLPVRVVGNLPYNVSSPILFKLLGAAEEGRTFTDATLMLQKEVADRLTARAGTADYGRLAIHAALVADAERLLTLPPGAFRPAPAVTSAVVRLRFRPVQQDVGDAATFERLVRGLFQQRRKTLLNALRPIAVAAGREPADLIAAAEVDGSRRPEDLTLADFARLSRAVL